MKYSEIKPVLKKMKAAGWRKLPGMWEYQRIWKDGNRYLRHTMMNWEIKRYAGDIDYILQRIDEEAKYKLYNYRPLTITE
jgi:hypothetical protein